MTEFGLSVYNDKDLNITVWLADAELYIISIHLEFSLSTMKR